MFVCTFLPFSTCLPHATRLSHLIPPLTFSSFPNHLCLFTCLSFCHITQTVLYTRPLSTVLCHFDMLSCIPATCYWCCFRLSLPALLSVVVTCRPAFWTRLLVWIVVFLLFFFLSIYLSKPLYSHPVLPWCLHLVHLLSCTYIYDTCLILFMT